ncbi:MAG TPA: hypothetical protein VJK54_06045 [Chthoniobacterales bacterium]|nr:hypothetical protein [Chthoniobacterales bacterium]
MNANTQSARANIVEKMFECAKWYNTGCNFKEAAENLEKALKAEGEGKLEVAQKYREATEAYTQSARAYAVGKTDEGENWRNVGNDFKEAAKYPEKVLKAEGEGKLEVAQKYREAIEAFTQSAKAYAEGKEAEGRNWRSAGYDFDSAAENLEKALKAEGEGKLEIAQKYREVAEAFTQSARAAAAGKAVECLSWSNLGYDLSEAAENLEKAIEVEVNKKPLITQVQPEVIEKEHSIKGAIKPALKKTDESASYNNKLVDDIKNESIIKATEAEANRKPDIAKVWHEIAQQMHLASECYTKAGDAGKTSEDDSLNKAALSYQYSGEQLKKAIEPDISDDHFVAAFWRCAANQNQLASESFTKAALAYAERKVNESDSLKYAGLVYQRAAEQLENAITAEFTRNRATRSCGNNAKGFYLESQPINYKSIEKSFNFMNINVLSYPLRDYEKVHLWRNAALLNQLAGKCFTMAVSDFATWPTKQENSQYNSGFAYLCAAEQLEKVIEAKSKFQAEFRDEISKFYTNAAIADSEYKTNEGRNWYKAALSCLRALEKSGDAAIKYKQASLRFRRAAEWYAKGDSFPIVSRFEQDGNDMIETAEAMLEKGKE